MRVLTVGNLYPPAARGGYERTWVAVVDALRARGDDVRVLTTAPVAGRELPAGHVDPPWVARTLRWYWRDFGFVRGGPGLERANARTLRAALAGVDAVAWFGMGGMSLSLLEVARRAGVPGIAIVGDDWLDYGRRADRWTRAWRRLPGPRTVAGVPTRTDLGGAARYLFASAWLRDRAAPLRLPRTAVLHQGVDPAAFPAQPVRDWGWRLACVGRVEPVKGIDVAVRALARLPPEATLTVQGDPDRAYRAGLERLPGAERVTFAPAGPPLPAYAAADAVLFPVTWEEPFGLVPLEAMSAGRPVVATGTGGSAEYLRGGENALVVPPGDPAALARAVRELAGDPALRARLRDGGLATAARHTEADWLAAALAALDAEAG